MFPSMGFDSKNYIKRKAKTVRRSCKLTCLTTNRHRVLRQVFRVDNACGSVSAHCPLANWLTTANVPLHNISLDNIPVGNILWTISTRTVSTWTISLWIIFTYTMSPGQLPLRHFHCSSFIQNDYCRTESKKSGISSIVIIILVSSSCSHSAWMLIFYLIGLLSG